MSNPNVINNANGNRTARKGIATALAAIVTPFLFTACKADIATASAPSTAPNTPLPAASAPVTPGSSSTNGKEIPDKYKNLPHCEVLMEEAKVDSKSKIPGVAPINDGNDIDIDGDGNNEPTRLTDGKPLCLTNWWRK